MAQAQTISGGVAPAERGAEAAVTGVAAKADPAPLGLAAFALTTFVLMLNTTGIIKGSSGAFVLGLALAYGGLAQLLAGMWEFRNGNTFGATAFTSFGAFWISYVAFAVLVGTGAVKGDVSGAEGTYLLAWGIFTTYMWIATLRHAWPVMIVFLLLALTFYGLALGAYQANDSITRGAGYIGIATAIAAWYASASNIINESFGRRILPR